MTDFSLIGQRLNAVADSAQMGGPCGEAARLMGGHRIHPTRPPSPTQPHGRDGRAVGGAVTRRVNCPTPPPPHESRAKRNSNQQLAKG